MKWPVVDTRKTIHEIENEYGICEKDERDDTRPSGYYEGPEPARRWFVRIFQKFLRRFR